MTQDSIGRFVWHDLMTTDAAKAMPFYKTLFGWNVIAHDMGGFEYQMIHIGDLPIGGFIQENLPKGVSSHWMTYVRVDDLDSCLEAVTDNGGEICVPAMPIPGTGRFAVITDPHGAAISPIQLDEAKPLPEQGTGSMFCWDELHSKNPVESKAFYTSVFGWTWGEMDMGPGGMYYLAGGMEKGIGGCMQQAPEDAGSRPAWVSYLLVDDVDACLAQAIELGAKMTCPPMDIPGMGRSAMISDPVGASVGIYSMGS